MNKTCDTCLGRGKRDVWVTSYTDSITNTMTKSEEIVCKACNGKGYTKCAAFSIEEAEAILKHCGLSKEL